MKQHILYVFVMLSALALAACGQGMNYGSNVSATKSVNTNTDLGGDTNIGGNDLNSGGDSLNGVEIDYEAIQLQALKDASDAEAATESAAKEAEKALNKISLGSGGISFGKSGDVDQQLVVDKLVKKILDKVVDGLKKVPEKFDMIRAKLAESMSKLDQNNPLHQKAIDVLMVAMEKVDMVEAKYKDLVSMVADKVDVVGDKLDLIAAGLPFPANILVQLELNAVKDVLSDFKKQLKNL